MIFASKMLFIFLLAISIFSCHSNQNKHLNLNNPEFINCLKYEISEFLYWGGKNDPDSETLLKFQGKKLEGNVILTKNKFPDQSEDYYVNFLGVPFENNRIASFEISSDEKNFYSLGENDGLSSCLKKELEDIGTLTIKIPNDWPQRGSSFDSDSLKLINKIKIALGRIIKSRNIERINTLYIGPFSKYSVDYKIYWPAQQEFILIGKSVEDVWQSDNIFTVTQIIDADKGNDHWARNCLKDGKLVKIKNLVN